MRQTCGFNWEVRENLDAASAGTSFTRGCNRGDLAGRAKEAQGPVSLDSCSKDARKACANEPSAERISKRLSEGCGTSSVTKHEEGRKLQEDTKGQEERQIVSLGWQINRSSGTRRNEKDLISKISLIGSVLPWSLLHRGQRVMYKLLHADRFMSRHISCGHARPRVRGWRLRDVWARIADSWQMRGGKRGSAVSGIKREKPRKTERIREQSGRGLTQWRRSGGHRGSLFVQPEQPRPRRGKWRVKQIFLDIRGFAL